MYINLIFNTFVKLEVKTFLCMKKLLLSLFFVGLFSVAAQAQTSQREPISANQKNDDGILVAYPNPARDVLVLKSKDANLKIKSVAFYSILGVQVAAYNVNSGSSEIRLDQLKSGKYLLRYTLSDNTQKVTQIIKQ